MKFHLIIFIINENDFHNTVRKFQELVGVFKGSKPKDSVPLVTEEDKNKLDHGSHHLMKIESFEESKDEIDLKLEDWIETLPFPLASILYSTM
jgi:hypothetical protein